MSAKLRLLCLCILVAIFLTGCGEDVAPPQTQTVPATGVASGTIGGSDFEIVFADAGDPNAPYSGPFTLRGTNVNYDETLGALLADLTIRNDTDQSYPLPVTLTFTRLLPGGVTVLNPDNDEHGAGAVIEFHFTNRDVIWGPGEESVPRTVQFSVEPDVAVAFTARLGIGEAPQGGTIAGVVYMDVNRNGERDSSEDGVPRQKLTLVHTGLSPATVIQVWETTTNVEGYFEFNDLRAGSYTLTKDTPTGVENTTPSVMYVLLTERGGAVTDFLEAEFGCIIPHEFYWFRRGDFVRVKGIFGDIPFHIFATETAHTRCWPPFRDCEPADPDCPCFKYEAMLRGPVTRLPSDDRPVIEVMGVPVWIAPAGAPNVDYSIDPETLEVGDQVETELDYGFDGSLIARTLHEWTGEKSEVHGTVESSFMGHSEAPPEITVLGVRIFYPEPAPLSGK